MDANAESCPLNCQRRVRVVSSRSKQANIAQHKSPEFWSMSLALALANTVTGHRTYQQIGLPSRRPSTTQARRPPSAVPTGLRAGHHWHQPRKNLSEIDTNRGEGG